MHSWSHSWTVLPPANHPRIFHEHSNTEPSIRAFVVSFVDGSSRMDGFFYQSTIHESFANTRIQSRPFAHSWSHSWTVLPPVNHPRIFHEHSNTEPSIRAFVVLFVDGSSRMDGSSSSQPSTNFSRILECRAVHSRIRGLIRGRFFLPANHPRTLKFTPSIRAFVVPFVDGFPARTVLSTSQPPTNTRMQSRPFAHSWSHSWTVFPRGRFFLPANHPRTLECRAVHS